MTTATAACAAYRAAGDPAEPPPVRTRDEMILSELPQVHYIAARILERLPKSVQMEDLVNAGVVGLIEAYSSYDHAKNTQFSTFAKFRIRGAILDSLRTLDWGSRSLRRRAREISEAETELEARLGRSPTGEEVAAQMDMTMEQLELARTQLDGLQIAGQQTIRSLDGEEIYDLIESAPSGDEDAFALFARAERKAHLAAAIAQLSQREQLILSLYYREQLTMKQVAAVIGVAVSRVSQLHNTAIGRLRIALEPTQRRGAIR